MLKKPTYLLISLLLCIPLIFMIYFAFSINIEAPADSTDITVKTADGYDFSFNETEDLSVYSAAVRGAKKISEVPDGIELVSPTVVTYTDTAGQYSHDYYLSLDPEKCYYKNAQGEFFVFDRFDAKQLIARKEFSNLYPNHTVPTLSFKTEKDSYIAKVGEYTWNFKRGEGFDEGLEPAPSSDRALCFNKSAELSLSFSQIPDTCELKVLKGNTTVHSASWESFTDGLDNISEKLLSQLYGKISYSNDTKLVCEITASWQQIDSSEFYGEATYRADLLFDVPFSCKKIDPKLSPGEFTFIKLNNLNEGETITFISGNDGLPLPETRAHTIGDFTFAFLPIDLNAKPGTYTVKAITENHETEFSIIVNNKEFKSTTVSKIHEMAGYDTSKLELEALVKTITSQSPEKHLWADAEVENTSTKYSKKYQFKKPVNATASTDFGTKVTEDPNLLTLTPYRKTGVFFETEKGSDVVATASGKVAHVGNIPYSGNFIIIDHGFGLLSVYENLSEVLVNSGDEVKIGSLIAKTGDTKCGYTFKSGMRFSVCLEGKYINPASNFSGISY